MKFEAYAREAILDHKERLYPLLRDLVRWVKGRRPFDEKNWGWGEKGPSFFPSDMFTRHGASHQRLRWSRWVVRGPFNHERAFWNLVRNALRDDLKQFQAIQAAIREGRPLTDDQQSILIMYQVLGTLRTIRWIEPDGAISIGTVLEADWARLNAGEEEMRAECLLVPVAYQLAVDWERSQPWPRYVITCHNPLCGRKFYSGRADAVTCPKAAPAQKSACKRVWDDYQKWLQKVQKDPAVDWADDALKRSFLGHYAPRGPDSRLRRENRLTALSFSCRSLCHRTSRTARLRQTRSAKMTQQIAEATGYEPLLVAKDEAARLTGISPRSLDRLVSCGKFLPPVRLGGRVMWNRASLERWVQEGCPALKPAGR
jgi:predicted DNA-binding transcriptional regulator AlpA